MGKRRLIKPHDASSKRRGRFSRLHKQEDKSIIAWHLVRAVAKISSAPFKLEGGRRRKV
jgi:hypothetical protein